MMNYDRTSSLCAELGPLHNAYPAAGLLSEALDDVGCDITDADKLAWVSPQPGLTPEGFITPSPGSPASLRFKMVKFAHCNLRSSVRRGSEHTAGAMTCVRIGFAK
jgi:hypothetical protein